MEHEVAEALRALIRDESGPAYDPLIDVELGSTPSDSASFVLHLQDGSEYLVTVQTISESYHAG